MLHQYLLFPELNYCPCPPRRSFSPRFDVRETTNAYIVEGELPGANRSNISVEFSDRGDLIVRGRVDRSRTTAVPQAQPQTLSSPASSPSQEASGKGKEKEEKEEKDGGVVPAPTTSAPSSPRSLKPTVEDVPDEDDWMGIVGSPTEKTRLEREAAKNPAERKEQSKGKREECPKRLLSERSVGDFARSFSFSAVIDYDAVTASLQHGVLRVVVPKKAFSVGKGIEIQ